MMVNKDVYSPSLRFVKIGC